MNWGLFAYDLGYLAVALVSIHVTGWFVFRRFILGPIDLAQELFYKRNLATATEIASFLTVEFLIAVSALSGEFAVNYLRDLEAVALTIAFSNLVFFSLRFLCVRFVRWKFSGQKDHQGDLVDFNNEIFKQANLAASLFSMSFMMLMYFMIIQEDFLGTMGYRVVAFYNMLGVLCTGLFLLPLYNLFFMPRGHALMKEMFLDNNVAAGLSFLGFCYAVLFFEANWLRQIPEGTHIFNAGLEAWAYLGFGLFFIVILRYIYIRLIGFAAGISFQQQFVVADNPVCGVLDLALLVSIGYLLGFLVGLN